MAKHDRLAQEKQDRNDAYAAKYRQRICRQCGHRTCVRGRCKMCGGTKWKVVRRH